MSIFHFSTLSGQFFYLVWLSLEKKQQKTPLDLEFKALMEVVLRTLHIQLIATAWRVFCDKYLVGVTLTWNLLTYSCWNLSWSTHIDNIVNNQKADRNAIPPFFINGQSPMHFVNSMFH